MFGFKWGSTSKLATVARRLTLLSGGHHSSLGHLKAHNKHQMRSAATHKRRASIRASNDLIARKLARATLPKAARKYVR